MGYPTLIYFNKVDKGGHFAAWEEPELFASEVRAAFRSLPLAEGRDPLRQRLGATVVCRPRDRVHQRIEQRTGLR